MINIKDEKFIKSFGLRLQELRGIKKITQEVLAYDADIPISQIGRIERGEINTTISTVKVLSKALGVEPKEMLNFPQ